MAASQSEDQADRLLRVGAAVDGEFVAYPAVDTAFWCLLAGLPAGLLHVLPGDAEPGAALAESPDVAMISFTGSTAVGRLVGEAAGRTLKRVSRNSAATTRSSCSTTPIAT